MAGGDAAPRAFPPGFPLSHRYHATLSTQASEMMGPSATESKFGASRVLASPFRSASSGTTILFRRFSQKVIHVRPGGGPTSRAGCYSRQYRTWGPTLTSLAAMFLELAQVILSPAFEVSQAARRLQQLEVAGLVRCSRRVTSATTGSSGAEWKRVAACPCVADVIRQYAAAVCTDY